MFYDRFLDLCEKHGLSPSFVVQEIGLNKSNATYWKKGSIPSGNTLQKLADYFGVSVDYLLGKTDTPFADLTGKTMTFQPITKTDDELLKLGGFGVLAEFYNLPEDAQKEAMKDIHGFVEYTIDKYKKQSSPTDQDKK